MATLTLGRQGGFSLGQGLTLGGGGAPPGYTRSTIDGVPVTYLGRSVYDNGVNIIYL